MNSKARLSCLLKRIQFASATSFLPIHSVVLYQSLHILKKVDWEEDGFVLLLHALSRSMLASTGVRDRCFLELKQTLQCTPHPLLCSRRLEHAVIPFARWWQRARPLGTQPAVDWKRYHEHRRQRHDCADEAANVSEDLEKIQLTLHQLLRCHTKVLSGQFVQLTPTSVSVIDKFLLFGNNNDVPQMEYCSLHLFVSFLWMQEPRFLFAARYQSNSEQLLYLKDVGCSMLSSSALSELWMDVDNTNKKLIVHIDSSDESCRSVVLDALRRAEGLTSDLAVEWMPWSRPPITLLQRPLPVNSLQLVQRYCSGNMQQSQRNVAPATIDCNAGTPRISWSVLELVISDLANEVGIQPDTLLSPNVLQGFLMSHLSPVQIRLQCHAHWTGLLMPSDKIKNNCATSVVAQLIPYRLRDRCTRLITAALLLEFPVAPREHQARRWARFACMGRPCCAIELPERLQTEMVPNHILLVIQFQSIARQALAIFREELLVSLQQHQQQYDDSTISMGCLATFIDTPEKLSQLGASILEWQSRLQIGTQSSCWIGVDIEFDSDMYFYEETAVLIQLSFWHVDEWEGRGASHAKTVVLDCASLDASSVRGILQMILSHVPSTIQSRWVLIFHAQSNDISILARQFGVTLTGVTMLDTARLESVLCRVDDQSPSRTPDGSILEQYFVSVARAKRQANPQNAGLGTLMERYLGPDVHKDTVLKFTDWMAKPIADDAVAYAAMDAAVLPVIAWHQLARMTIAEKLSVAQVVSHRLQQFHGSNRTRRIKSSLEQLVLRSLNDGAHHTAQLKDALIAFLEWRDIIARRLGCAPSVICPIGTFSDLLQGDPCFSSLSMRTRERILEVIDEGMDGPIHGAVRERLLECRKLIESNLGFDSQIVKPT